MGKKLIFTAFLLLTLLISGCYGSSEASDTKNEKLGYNIIEKGYLGSSILEEWYDKNYKTFGYHFTSDDHGNRYVIISAGEMPTGGYELILNSVVEEPEKVTFVAELKYPQEGEMVTQALTYPHLLIKANFNGKDINAEMNNVEETYLNVTGSFTGRIDNNSVEIDLGIPRPGFPREGKQAFRLNDETRNWFDINSPLETETRLKFDVQKDRNGQFTVTRIKASGDEVEVVIRGHFEGQIDNNFIEVIVEGRPQSFKLSEESKNDFDPSIYENQEVAMLCLRDKTYKYIVLDMKPVEQPA